MQLSPGGQAGSPGWRWAEGEMQCEFTPMTQALEMPTLGK